MWIFFLSPLNIYVNGENRLDNIKLFRKVVPQIYIFQIYTGPKFTQIPDLHGTQIYTNPDLHGTHIYTAWFTQIHFRT